MHYKTKYTGDSLQVEVYYVLKYTVEVSPKQFCILLCSQFYWTVWTLLLRTAENRFPALIKMRQKYIDSPIQFHSFFPFMCIGDSG